MTAPGWASLLSSHRIIVHTMGPPPRSTTSRRNRVAFRILVWIALLLAAYQVLWTWYLAGVNIPDVEIDPLTGQQKVRRRPDRLRKYDPEQGKGVATSPFDGIMEGYLALVNIKVPPTGLQSTTDRAYSGVQATFCHLSWQSQQDHPAQVPTLQDVKDESPLCLGTLFSVDLHDITRQATDYDNRNHTFAATVPKRGQGPVDPTMVLFHESRCGSTLVANLLAAYQPTHVRVYAEAPAPLAALAACDHTTYCDRSAHLQLVRDVFYMMGRVTRLERPQYVFYKLQSVAALYLDTFVAALPETPWMYLYRDSTEVLMSHFQNYYNQHGNNPLSDSFFPPCLRNWGEPQQSPLLKEIVATQGRTIESLSKPEYCAAHLATLGEAAVRQASATPHVYWVNYESLPFAVWEDVLPNLVGPLTGKEIDALKRVSKLYSKGKGDRQGQLWKEDGMIKQSKAPPEVVEAAKLFLEPTYNKLEIVRKGLP